MRNVKVQSAFGVVIEIQIEDDNDLPSGYTLVDAPAAKAKTAANKARTPANKAK